MKINRKKVFFYGFSFIIMLGLGVIYLFIAIDSRALGDYSPRKYFSPPHRYVAYLFRYNKCYFNDWDWNDKYRGARCTGVYRDGGKKCKNSDECEGHCILPKKSSIPICEFSKIPCVSINEYNNGDVNVGASCPMRDDIGWGPLW